MIGQRTSTTERFLHFFVQGVEEKATNFFIETHELF